MTRLIRVCYAVNFKNRLSDMPVVPEIIEKLRKATAGMTEPMSISIISLYGRDPFLVLVSCLLSSRTKDSVTLLASIRLFSMFSTVSALSQADCYQIEKCIFPVGFYRQKSKMLIKLVCVLVQNFNGRVPDSFNDLITLPGVGPKTANLVLGIGFGIPAVCVDVHVHRICNRLGLLETTTPAETEQQLKALVPRDYWIELNRLLVMWGQNVCVPVSPFCSRCVLADVCKKREVIKKR